MTNQLFRFSPPFTMNLTYFASFSSLFFLVQVISALSSELNFHSAKKAGRSERVVLVLVFALQSRLKPIDNQQFSS